MGAGRVGVPLSEDEQRILENIEAQLEQEDPKFVREVSRTSVYTHAGRQLKLAIAGVVLGFLLMVVLLSISVPLSLVAGFGLAFTSAVWGYYAFRKMTKAGFDDLRRKSRGFWQRGMSTERLKRHFKNPDD